MVTAWNFVSLLARSTGRRPWRDRLTAVAAVRVVDGRPAATYATALTYNSSGRRQFGDWDAVDDAEPLPSFAAIEPALREFLGSLPLVGPDVRLHLAHLSYELSRLNRPGLDNPCLDLGRLAELVLGDAPRQPKPTLSRLAEQLGLPPCRPGDFESEARLAALAALRLAASLDPLRFPDLPAVLSAVEQPSARPLLEPHRAGSLPSQPGVYLLRDDRARPLYVGKARDLQTRVSTYLGHPLSAPRRMDGLAEATAQVELHPTGSDLEAGLLEAHLLRELAPPYNVQRRARPPRLFLRLHLGAPRPRLAESAQVASDGAIYLGPFRSASAARRARRLAEAVFELGPTGRTHAGRQNPRTGDDKPPQSEDVRERLQAALLLLSGQRGPAIERLQARMRQAAAAGDTLELARLRALMAQTQAFSVQDAALSLSPHTDTFLAFDGRQAYLVHAARLVTRVAAPSLAEARQAVAPALATLSPPSQTVDEDAHLVLRWLAGRGPGWQVVRL